MSRTFITEIAGKWYAYEADAYTKQVKSIGRDNPSLYSARGIADWTEKGIRFVSSPSPSKDAALKKARYNGEYSGVFKVR